MEQKQWENLAFEMTKNNVSALDVGRAYAKQYAPELLGEIEEAVYTMGGKTMPEPQPKEVQGKAADKLMDKARKGIETRKYVAGEFAKEHQIVMNSLLKMLEMIARVAPGSPDLNIILERFKKIYVFFRDQNIRQLQDLVVNGSNAIVAKSGKGNQERLNALRDIPGLTSMQNRMQPQQQQVIAKKKK